MMIRSVKYSLVLLLAATTLCGCFKKVTTDTTLVIKPLVQQLSGGELLPAEGVEAYAYYTSDTQWEVLSYDDALNRIITHKESGEKLSAPSAEGQLYTREGDPSLYVALPQTASPALIVALYPAAQAYGYMYHHLVAENLPHTFITLIFHTWKSAPYKEGDWNVVPYVAPAEDDQTENDQTEDDQSVEP